MWMRPVSGCVKDLMKPSIGIQVVSIWNRIGIGFCKKGIERCGGWATRSAKAEGEDERREVAAAASERRRKKPAGEGRAKAEDGSDVDRRRGAPFIFRETGCERYAEINGIASTRASGATKTKASSVRRAAADPRWLRAKPSPLTHEAKTKSPRACRGLCHAALNRASRARNRRTNQRTSEPANQRTTTTARIRCRTGAALDRPDARAAVTHRAFAELRATSH